MSSLLIWIKFLFLFFSSRICIQSYKSPFKPVLYSQRHILLNNYNSKVSDDRASINESTTAINSNVWGKQHLKYTLNNDTVIWNNATQATKSFFEKLSQCQKQNNNVNNVSFMDIESLGFNGRWIEDSGNFLLPPPDGMKVEGVVHFLGGAFVGAAPHLTYRYLLESLSKQGYLIVTTPYRLEFDYIAMIDEILTKFDDVGVKLANMYGPLPVIGIGHSCGALLQALITSLFPDAPRAVNVLISFNNRPADSAIPLFEEVVIPISEAIMDKSTRSSNLRQAFSISRGLFGQVLDNYSKSVFVPKFMKNEFIPFVNQSLEIVDQIPTILQMISDGKREFDPDPLDTKHVCRQMYRARNTLIIRFENDDLDDSYDIEKVLKEASALKSGMMDVQFKEISGSHITPLTQNILIDPVLLETLPNALFGDSVGKTIEGTIGGVFAELVTPLEDQFQSNFLKTINQLVDEVVSFLEMRIKNN